MNQPLVTEVQLFEEEASLRVLLAEDDRSLRRLLAVILRREGHDVVEVGDGAELLEAMAASLVDPRMPPFDGIRRPRASPAGDALGVVRAGGAARARPGDRVRAVDRQRGRSASRPRARRRRAGGTPERTGIPDGCPPLDAASARQRQRIGARGRLARADRKCRGRPGAPYPAAP